MKYNAKAKLILICLGALLSLSFVFGSNVANYPAKLNENSVNMSEQNSGEPSISTNGAFGTLWTANGKAVTDSTDLSDDPLYGVIKDGNGGAIIAWQDQIGGTWDIYAQKINSAGERRWGRNGIVICNATGGQYNPRICSDEAGGAIIVWKDERYGPTNREIYAQHVDSNGLTHWGESWWSGPSDLNGTVICNATGHQYNQQICSDEAGGAIIAWRDTRMGIGKDDIYAQYISSEGTTQWGESWWNGPNDRNGTVICNATSDQYDPQICSYEAGGAIITWVDNRGVYDIYAQNISSDGTTNWGESWWSGPNDLNGTVICNATSAQQSPQILITEVGDAIITWSDYRGTYDIYAQNISSGGVTQWGESWWSGPNDHNGTVICNATGGQYNPQICSDDAGGAIITWHDWSQVHKDIYAQHINSSGNTQWGDGSIHMGIPDRNGTVICNANGHQDYQQICSDGAGGAIIAWKDERYSTLYNDIYVQHVDSDGNTHWGNTSYWGGNPDRNGTAMCSVSNGQAELGGLTAICSDDNGGAIVAWYDNRGTGWSMYAQRMGIRSAGVLPPSDDDDDDDDDDDTGVVVVVVVIIIIACVGGVVVVVIVLIKKVKTGTSKLKRG